jgi:hypothetical protein
MFYIYLGISFTIGLLTGFIVCSWCSSNNPKGSKNEKGYKMY